MLLGTVFSGSAPNVNNGLWQHYAISRSASVLKLFIEGAQIYSGANTTNILANGQFGIGRNAASTTYVYNGYLDDIRITKGTGRYTAAFTPPTAAFPNS